MPIHLPLGVFSNPLPPTPDEALIADVLDCHTDLFMAESLLRKARWTWHAARERGDFGGMIAAELAWRATAEDTAALLRNPDLANEAPLDAATLEAFLAALKRDLDRQAAGES